MLEIIIGIIITFLIGVFAYIKKALTFGGMTAALVLMIAILFWSGLNALLMLILAYLLIIAVDMLFKDRIENVTSSINKKSGTRDIVQVMANGLTAGIAILVYGITDNPDFLFLYVIGIGEALADSIASDIGVLSKKEPFDICTFKRISKGISGGVSLLGIISSFVFCLVYTFFSYIFIDFKFSMYILILLIPFLGCIIDSILGSRVQSKYRCRVSGKYTEKKIHCHHTTDFVKGVKFIDNCCVNFISNSLTIIIGFLLIKFI